MIKDQIHCGKMSFKNTFTLQYVFTELLSSILPSVIETDSKGFKYPYDPRDWESFDFDGFLCGIRFFADDKENRVNCMMMMLRGLLVRHSTVHPRSRGDGNVPTKPIIVDQDELFYYYALKPEGHHYYRGDNVVFVPTDEERGYNHFFDFNRADIFEYVKFHYSDPTVGFLTYDMVDLRRGDEYLVEKQLPEELIQKMRCTMEVGATWNTNMDKMTYVLFKDHKIFQAKWCAVIAKTHPYLTYRNGVCVPK